MPRITPTEGIVTAYKHLNSNRNVFLGLSSVFRHLSNLSKQFYLSRAINIFIQRSKKSESIFFKASNSMKANKNNNRMNIMIIIIVQPLIAAIKIDPHSIQMKSIQYEKRAHEQPNERTDRQSTRDERKLKIICFKNGIQMPRDQNMNRIELNWMESEKKEHIHILKYLKRKSIHAIMYWKYELRPIDSFSPIPNHGREENMNHILLNLNNVAWLLCHRHSLMCHIIFGFERPFASAWERKEKGKIEIYTHIKVHFVKMSGVLL